MHKKLLFILTTLFLVSCISTRDMINSGDYSSAVANAVRKLIRDKKNEKEIYALEEAYKKANDRDKERIEFLKKEGNPDNWEEIFNIYNHMKNRQEMVRPLVPLNIPSSGRTANIQVVNYDDDIIAAKQKAAEYFYARAKTHLEKNNRFDARQAYYDFKHVKQYYSNYRDTDELQRKAERAGTTHVIFKMQNKTGFPLPENFENELTKLSLTELNRDWVMYHTSEQSGEVYHYTILVNMKTIDVGPDQIRDNPFTESKEVPDGFQYVLDAKGNVKKDSLGNDIKVPKTKTISCNVVEKIQLKKAMIAGSLDYIDNTAKQLIKTDPLGAEHIFEYRSVMAFGDLNALKAETKAKLGRQPMPFPPGSEMVLMAGQTLKNMVKDIIWREKGRLQ